MITSAQIIARNQTEVASKLNALLQYVPTAATEFMLDITPFGTNQFLVVITWNQVGGLRTFAIPANNGMGTKMTKLPNKAVRPKMGLRASIKLLYNELFAYVPKLGLKTTIVRNIVKRGIIPLLGQTAAFRAKQKPTRELPIIGFAITPTKKKNGATVSPF